MVSASAARESEAKVILVVDDDATFASVVVDVLTEEDYRVATATSGTTALDLVGGTPFDLVLLDVRMPGLDGAGFFREFQVRDPEMAHRVMFMTGGAVRADVAELFFTGRVPYLRKPLPIEDLRAAVRRFFLTSGSFPGFRKPDGRH